MTRSLAEVAISVAREDSAVAAELSRRLRNRGIRVYFYLHQPEQTLGLDLRKRLTEIYSSAPLVIVVNSSDWPSETTELELGAALGGAAGQTGIIPLRIGTAPLPQQIQGRTWWDAAAGLDGLIDSVVARLGRRALRGPILYTCALLLSTALAIWWIALQGYSDLSKLPDLLFLVTAGLPVLWTASFHLLPTAINRVRRRTSAGDVLLQSGVERILDRARSYAAWLFALGLLSALVYGAALWEERLLEIESIDDARSDLSSHYHQYRNVLNTVTTLADRASVATTAAMLSEIKDEFRAAVVRQRELGSALIDRLRVDPGMGVSEPAGALGNAVAALERAADRNMGHQVDELARVAGEGDPYERSVSLRTTLRRWNGLFVQQMADCEAAYKRLDVALGSRRAALTEQWFGGAPETEDEP